MVQHEPEHLFPQPAFDVIARLWAEADARAAQERRALKYHTKQSRLVLKDLLMENGFPTDMRNLCKVLKLFVGHRQANAAKQLVARIEKPRRDEFIKRIDAVLQAGELPTVSKIWNGPGSYPLVDEQSFRSEQVRWRRDYLTSLGWTIRNRQWLPPGVEPPKRVKRLRRTREELRWIFDPFDPVITGFEHEP